MSNRQYQLIAVIVVVLAPLFYIARNHWSSVLLVILCIFLGLVWFSRYLNRRFKEKWSSFANQLGVEFISPGSGFQELIGIGFFLAKKSPWLRGVYRNHPLVMTTYLEGERGDSRDERGKLYFRLRVGIAQPNIKKCLFPPRIF